jgi:acyl carrier protein
MELPRWVGDATPVFRVLKDRLANSIAAPLSPGEREAVTGAVRRVLADELQHPLAVVELDARLVETLGADSLTFVEVFAELAETLAFGLNANQAGRFLAAREVVTVGELAAAIVDILEAAGHIPDVTT